MSKPSLKPEITSVLLSDDLPPEKKAFLDRWLADSRADDIWSKIEAKIENQYKGLPASELKLLFIHEILSGLLIANHPPDSKALLRQAENADSFANFLHGPSSRPPILPNSAALIVSLVDASRTLREIAQRQIEKDIRQRSRDDRNGSRKRVAFSWAVSDTLRSFCGQPCDEAAAFFTDLAFPSKQTDAEAADELVELKEKMRNTRRPRTRAERTKRPS